MTTSTRKSLSLRLALAMQAAGISQPITAAAVALRFIRAEFNRCEGDDAAVNDLAMTLMGEDE